MSLGTASVHSTFRGKEKATVEKLHTTQTANNMFTYMSLGAASVHSTFCGKEKATVKKKLHEANNCGEHLGTGYKV